MRFEGRTVLVTGGTGALGRHVTKAFLEEGATVAVSYIIGEELVELKQLVVDHVSRLKAYEADVTSDRGVTSLVTDVMQDLGSIDILVNIVGGYMGGKTVSKTSLKEWDYMMDLNLRSAFLCCRKVVPHMEGRGHGKIVNVSSRTGLAGEAGHAPYSVSKSGVMRLTESLAEEVKERGINVNCILPSIIDTPANRSAMPKAEFSKWPKPWEVAPVILFLASDDAKLLHGASIPVYGLA
jgi:NAD(P)-dependent dehydrogenase (short-subunit alcohol dehydrogenase family)